MSRHLLFIVILLLNASGWASATRYASLHILRADMSQPVDDSTCVDTAPLDTCLFGTKKHFFPRQKFVNITLARHVGGNDCSDIAYEYKKLQDEEGQRKSNNNNNDDGKREDPAAAKDDLGQIQADAANMFHGEAVEKHLEYHRSQAMKNRLITIAVPVSTDPGDIPLAVPIREFHGLNKVGETGAAAAETQAMHENRYFGRPLDTGSFHTLSPFGKESIAVSCDVDDHEQNSYKIKECHVKVLQEHNDDFVNKDAVDMRIYPAGSAHVSFSGLGNNFFCGAVTSAVYESDALATVQYSRRDCTAPAAKDAGAAAVASLLPFGGGKIVQFARLDHARGWYSVVISPEGKTRVAEQGGPRSGLRSLIKITNYPPKRCYQASLLSSLYCRSCSGAATSTSAADTTSSTTLHQQQQQQWLGPCPVQLVEHFRPNRILNFELDPICRPATCASMRVFSSRDRCQESFDKTIALSRKGKETAAAAAGDAAPRVINAVPHLEDNAIEKRLRQQELFEERRRLGVDSSEITGKVLTLPCGDVHDRDSTGSYMHNVFMRCALSNSSSRLLLFGECKNRWCKSVIELEQQQQRHPQQQKDQDEEQNDCIVAERGLLMPARNQFLHMVDVSDCHTFGVRVSRKEKYSRAADSDRFASGFCIPTKLGGLPNIEPTCIDWTARLPESSSSSSSLTTQLLFDVRLARPPSSPLAKKQQATWESTFLSLISAESGSDKITFAWKTADTSTVMEPLLSLEITAGDGYQQQQQQQFALESLGHHRITVQFTSWRDLVSAHSLTHSQLRSLNVISMAIEGLPKQFPSAADQQQKQKQQQQVDVDCEDTPPEEFPLSVACGKKFTLPPVQRNFVAKYDDRVWQFDEAPTRHNDAPFKRWRIGDKMGDHHQQQQQEPRVEHHNKNNHQNRRPDVPAEKQDGEDRGVDLRNEKSGSSLNALLFGAAACIVAFVVYRRMRAKSGASKFKE